MISVLILCYSRQDMLDITLPLWLKQLDVDYEIVLGIGPGIKIPVVDSKLNIVICPELKFCKSYNSLIKAAHGDILLITYCDIQVNSPYQLKRMLDRWHDKAMVTDKVFRNGKRNLGVYLDCMMVSKAAVDKVGGWCELYDDPKALGHEDGDMVASMLENGLQFEFMETVEDEALYHINHPAPRQDMTKPENVAAFEYARKIFFTRHETGIMALYAKQMVSRLSGKRVWL